MDDFAADPKISPSFVLHALLRQSFIETAARDLLGMKR